MSTSRDQPPGPTRNLGDQPFDASEEAGWFRLIAAGREADRVLRAGAISRERAARLKVFSDAGRIALRRIIEAHLALVVEEAGIVGTESRRDISLGELVQRGNLALVQAVERFDPSRGTRFATYARWMVSTAMRPDIDPTGLLDARVRERVALRAAIDRLAESEPVGRGSSDDTSIDLVRVRAMRDLERAHGKQRHPSMRRRMTGTGPA